MRSLHVLLQHSTTVLIDVVSKQGTYLPRIPPAMVVSRLERLASLEGNKSGSTYTTVDLRRPSIYSSFLISR